MKDPFFEASVEMYKKSLKDVEEAKRCHVSACCDFGKALASKRKQQRETLRELGKRLNLSAAYLNDVEHGRRWPNEAILNAY